MSDSRTTSTSTPPPFARTAEEVLEAAGSDAGTGLRATDAAARLASHGPNAITAEKQPSPWAIAAVQLRDPMNLMLVAALLPLTVEVGKVLRRRRRTAPPLASPESVVVPVRARGVPTAP